MGRTQPSLTRAVEMEMEKLDRVARKLRDRRMAEKLDKTRAKVREVQEALQDEVTDPLEVIMIALMVSE